MHVCSLTSFVYALASDSPAIQVRDSVSNSLASRILCFPTTIVGDGTGGQDKMVHPVLSNMLKIGATGSSGAELVMFLGYREHKQLRNLRRRDRGGSFSCDLFLQSASGGF